MGTIDNSMVALDAKTGAEVWKVNIEDMQQCGCNITGAPLVVKDKVDRRRHGWRFRPSRLPQCL